MHETRLIIKEVRETLLSSLINFNAPIFLS